ncbi:type I secretion system permease/ATPase [Ruegeria sp. HKCCA5426]|uniref:type I secretion system permease/ATPase n=1 Tax=Ruegeria sp. HKCCA5426 TaxID=2682985 RepID=UPI0014886E35|nr:type I secretion system permease/ATPase [Ruegeria sp. HKCCA5426]
MVSTTGGDKPKKIRPHIRRLVATVIVFSIFTNLLMLTGPLFMLQVYDRVLASRSEETLVALFGLVAILYLFYGLIEFARGRIAARAGARFQTAFDESVFRAVLEDTAVRGGQHKQTAPLDALASIRTFFTAPVFLSLLDLPWTPIFIGCIFIFHPYLGWMAGAGGLTLIAVAFINQFVTYKRLTEANGLSHRADRFADQAEEGGELIWAQGMSQAMVKRWQDMRAEGVKRTIAATDWTGSFTASSKAFRLFLQSAILAVGAWLVLQNEISAGAMIAASILMGRALAPVEQSLGSWQIVQNALSGRKRLKTFLADNCEREPTLELPRPEAKLLINDVSVVVRRGDEPILKYVKVQVSPGESLGVIGKSGSGKTTLARVIVGLVTPVAGEVRLNGAKLEHYGPEQLGQHIGYLPQDVVLFDGSVAENIAQMDLNPDSELVIKAAKKARVHGIIQKLPDGYNTRIGTHDAQLSGGQKQRLALARALYRDPVLLVLDEPNSALDADGSEALNSVVREMKADNRAVVIMTHRPTAISECNNLVILDQGKVAAQGPRDEVIKSTLKNANQVQSVVSGKTS